MIAIQIVHDIATLDPPGRFLIEGAAKKGTHVTNEKQDVSDKVWVIVEEDKAVNKVMHRLRERDKSAVAGDAATSRGAQDPSQVLSSLGGWKKNEYPPLYPPLQQQQQVRSQYSDGMPDFVQSSEVHRAGYDDLETRNQQNVIGAMLPDSGLLDEGLVNEEDLLEDILINEAVRRITSINTRSSIPSFAGSNRNSLASHLSGGERSRRWVSCLSGIILRLDFIAGTAWTLIAPSSVNQLYNIFFQGHNLLSPPHFSSCIRPHLFHVTITLSRTDTLSVESSSSVVIIQS